MSFDLTINLGHLLTLLTIAAGGMWFLSSFRTDLQVVVTRLGQFDDELKSLDRRLEKIVSVVEKQAQTMIDIARQEQRLDGIDQRFTDALKERRSWIDFVEVRVAALEKRNTQTAKRPSKKAA